MRSAAALLVVVACQTPAVRPAQPGPASPSVADNIALAPAIVVPVRAEAEYVALDPHDSRLDRACDDLAYLVAHGGAATTDIATAVLRMHGIVDPPNAVLVGAVGEALDAKLGEDLYRPNAVIGRGTYEQTAVEVLVFLPHMHLGPVPRAVETSVDVSVVIDRELSDARVTVADQYETMSPRVTRDEDVLHFTVPCGTRPSDRFVTIEAADPRTATQPLVIFPVYCKLAPPATLSAEPARNLANVSDIEGRLTSILNRERTTASVLPLRRDARVEAAARAYAKSRADKRNTDQEVVMRDAGILAPEMSWSTFHVDSLEAAVNRILNSSEELAKLRDAERTEVGVGVAQDADGWWVSLVYVTIPPPLDTVAAAARIADAIRLTGNGHEKKVKIDLYANEIATRYANGLAVGWKVEDLYTKNFAAMRMYNHVGFELTVDRRVELAHLDVAKLIKKHEFHTIGVGVSQSARNGPLAGTIWIVVVFY